MVKEKEIIIAPSGKKYYILPSGYRQYLCSEEECISRAYKNSKCHIHGGGKRKCQYQDCEKWARLKSIYCVKHGGKKEICSVEGCKNVAYSKKLCGKHKNIKCSVEGCNSRANGGGKCYKHNPKICSEEGCTFAVRRNGKCQRHVSEEFSKAYSLKRYTRYKNRRKTDIKFKIYDNCRLRAKRWLIRYRNEKKVSHSRLVGCTQKELRKYLQKKFLPGMTWDNYGEWHIDHIRPCCSFDLSDPEEQKKCFNYTNLQPLWAKDNMKKGGRW